MMIFSARSAGRVVLILAVAVAGACSDNPEYAKQEYLKSGNHYFDEKKYAEAIVEYRNALQVDGKFGPARYKLAHAYEVQGDFQNAFREMIRAADALPDSAEVQVRAASYLLISGQYAEARARAEQALRVEPRNVEAHVILGQAHARSRSFEAALKQIEEAVKIDPTSGTGFATLGMIEAARGNAEEAETAFKRAISLDSNNTLSHLSYAGHLWATNRQEEAEGVFKQTLAIDPDNILAHRALTTFYLSRRRAPEAERHLKFLADHDGSPDGAMKLRLADYYLAVNRPEDALNVLAAVSKDAGAASAQVRTAAIEYKRKGAAVGNRLIDEVLARESKNSSALLTKAQFLFREGKVDEAIGYAKRAIDSNPQSVQAHYLLGVAYTRQGRPDEAGDAFAEVLRLNPRVVAAQVQLSRLRLLEGARDEGLQLAREAARALPDDPSVQLTLVENLLASREPEAETRVAQLVKQFPGVASVQVLAGRVALTKGDVRGARAAFERAERADPSSVDALKGQLGLDLHQKNLAAAKARVDARLASGEKDQEVLALAAGVYSRLGDVKRSEELLLAAVQADGTSLEPFISLAQLYAAQNRLAEARRQLEAVIAKRPAKIGAPTMIGMLYEAEGKVADAKKQYQAVLQLDSSAAVAANNLAFLYAQEGSNLDVALSLAQTAKMKLPDAPEVSDTLGWVYVKKGLASLALVQLEDAATKLPQNGAVQYHLAVALAKTGNVDRAKKALERALSLPLDSASADEAKLLAASL